MKARYFEDISIGDKYESGTKTVSEEDLFAYCRAAGNTEPLHLDREFIKKHTQFKDLLVPGPLTLGIANALEGTAGQFHGTSLGLLGVDELRLPNPVYPGDTLKVLSEIVYKRETSRADRGVVKIKNTVQKQDGTVVCEFTRIFLLKRRAAA